MSMFTQAGIVLATMVAVYVVVRAFRISTELAMFGAALGGALVAGFGLPGPAHRRGRGHLPRHQPHLRHGDALHEPPEGVGGRDVRRPVDPEAVPPQPRAAARPADACCCSCPGALTGAGSVTVLVAGSLVAVVLHYMGIPKHKAAALIFINAGLSAAAPPVSLWAMMTAAGVNMPYVGFFWPLLLPCLVAGAAHQLHPRVEGRGRQT